MIKSKLLTGTVLAGAVLGMSGVLASAPTVLAADANATANTSVTANIVSGGLKLEIEGNGSGVDAKDAFLGDLTIGEAIPDATVTGLTNVTDHTGANGWNLTVKADNYDSTKNTLAVKLKVGAEAQASITGNDISVADGESKLAEQTSDGVFSATWGAIPEQGDYTSNLTWTLSPIISPVG